MESKPTPLTADAQRAERFDRNLRSALDDVSLPAGLTDRLLAGCEAALVTPAKTEGAKSEIQTPRSRFSRRQMLAMLTTAASVSVLISGGWLGLGRKPRPVTADELAQSALSWFDRSGPAANWQPLVKAPVTQFPVADAVAVRPARWLKLDSSVVVYELPSPERGRQRALLFVQRTNRPHPALKNFPSTRLTASGGLGLIAWQRGSAVYVIAVVEADQMHKFIKPPPKLT